MATERKKEKWQATLESKQERLALYKAMEEKILTGSPQSYSLGSRSKTNYSMSPDELHKIISKLEEEIEELEGLIAGERSRKVVSIVPRF